MTDATRTAIDELIAQRYSERARFDPNRPISEEDLDAILKAARWAPTAHNMQNFEIVVVDDPRVLAEIANVHGSGVSEEFIRENYEQLSFSEDEFRAKGTGLLATMFPPSWRDPEQALHEPVGPARSSLGETTRSCPVVLIVLYDPRKRAPASEGDFLGIISLGCVMQNMWLTAASRSIGMQIMSVFSGAEVEPKLRSILSIPQHLKIAYACRLGYAEQPREYLRVRRELSRFVHRNTY